MTDRPDRPENPVLDFLDFAADGDEWGDCMMGWFGIAAVLHAEGSRGVPDRWRYQPGAGASEVDADAWPDADLAHGLRSGEWTEADMIEAGDYLSELADALRAEGKDY